MDDAAGGRGGGGHVPCLDGLHEHIIAGRERSGQGKLRADGFVAPGVGLKRGDSRDDPSVDDVAVEADSFFQCLNGGEGADESGDDLDGGWLATGGFASRVGAPEEVYVLALPIGIGGGFVRIGDAILRQAVYVGETVGGMGWRFDDCRATTADEQD